MELPRLARPKGCYTVYDIWCYTSSWDALRADLDTLGLLRPYYSLRHRRDSSAGTTIPYHLLINHQAHSLSVMTAGRRELLEHGHRHRFRRGSRTFQGLRTGRSSERTKPE